MAQTIAMPNNCLLLLLSWPYRIQTMTNKSELTCYHKLKKRDLALTLGGIRLIKTFVNKLGDSPFFKVVNPRVIPWEQVMCLLSYLSTLVGLIPAIIQNVGNSNL